MKKYKAICFDVDGTLYPLDQLKEMLVRLRKRIGSLVDEFQEGRNYLRTIQDSDERKSITDCETYYGLEVHCFKKQYPSLISKEKAEELLGEYYKGLSAEYKELKAQKVVRETLLDIKKAGIKIGVFSDWPLYDKLEILDVADIPDCSFACFDSTCVKPSAKAFEPMIKALNLKPSEILYVGDSYIRDGIGSINAGLDFVLVNAEKNKDYPGAIQVFCNFEEFRNWLIENKII